MAKIKEFFIRFKGKFKKSLRKNFLKIVSVLFAVVLWSMASANYHPIIERTIEVPLTFLNKDVLQNEKYLLANEEELNSKRIALHLKGESQEVESLIKAKDDIKATIDLEAVIYSAANKLGKEVEAYINVILPKKSTGDYDKSIIDNRGSLSAAIILDKREDVEKPIELAENVKTGEGYEGIQHVIEPEVVKISGPKTLVDKIKKVVVSLSDSDTIITSDTNKKGKILVYDNEGKDITASLALNINEAEVKITVYKSFQVLVNPPTTHGNVADGYAISDTSYSPKHITIVGKDDDIKNVQPIQLDTIEITDETETKDYTFDIMKYFEDKGIDVEIKNGTPKTVVVRIEIEKKEERELEIPVEQFEIKKSENPLYTSEISSEPIKITVSGIRSIIDAIDQSKIKGTLDISALEPGTHTVYPEITLPDNVEIVSEEIGVNVEIFGE